MRHRAFPSAIGPGDEARLYRGAHKARSCRDLTPEQRASDPRTRMVNVSNHTHPLRDSFVSETHGFLPSLFVLKFKPTGDGSGGANPSAELVIDHVIPIVGKFSISVALSKRNTINLRNPSSPLTMNKPKTGLCPLNTNTLFSPFEPLDNTEHLTSFRNRRFIHTELRITITPGHQLTHDQFPEQITLLANDLQRLRFVLEECKRLKQISGLSSPPPFVVFRGYLTTVV
jgi:hypothetical protein